MEYITISKTINKSLGGGFPKRQLSLLYGPPASGKSLFCLAACNSSKKSCYIDSMSHISAFSLLKDPASTMIYRPQNFVEFEQAIDRATRAKFPLLIVDSFTRFYLDTINNKNFPSYNHALSSLLTLLSSYARRENAAVILTSGISRSGPIGGSLFDPVQTVIHLENNVLHLKRAPLKDPTSSPFLFSDLFH